MAISGIIFDHDGTLVDSEGVHFSIWQNLLLPYGISFSKTEYLQHHCGVPTRRNAELIVAQHELDISPEELYQKKQHEMQQWLQQQCFPAMHGARAALLQCHSAGLKIGVATGAGQLETQSSLQSHNLDSLVAAVTTREMVTNSKPAPDTYLQTLDALQLRADVCVAVEDSTTGIASAKAAGLACIAVAYDFAKGQDLSRADHYAANLLEAVAIALAL